MIINGIFFDLYGTLLVYGDMKAAWSDWLSEFHKRLRLRGLTLSVESFAKACNRFFGKSEPAVLQDNLTVFERRIQSLCFDLKLNLASEEIKEIANVIANAWQKHISLDPDALPVLHALRSSKKLALVSNFDHPPHVHAVITKLGLRDFFDSVVVSAEVGVKKPNPRIFDFALKRTGLKPQEIVYVGDTEDDIIAARAAGIVPVLIQRDSRKSRGNPSDFSIDERVLSQKNRQPDVIIITGLSELITLFV